MTGKSANSKLKNKQETKETNSNQKRSTNKTNKSTNIPRKENADAK